MGLVTPYQIKSKNRTLLYGILLRLGIYEINSLHYCFKGLKERGIDRTWESCRTKIKGLKQSYLKAKLHNNTSGQSRSRFLHFDRLEEFLGSKPLTEPSCVVDTTDDMGAKGDTHMYMYYRKIKCSSLNVKSQKINK